ncbi:MAG: NAD(P)/FAD-dependent oxidoreductase [Kofleriaceae bacterium]|nr:NAD(P)/FAD-dependent oxidoreductase [Kofleriaceae bacterium]
MHESHDVVIVGGSYAGLAAALQLGRARRSVVVLDAGKRRNRFAAHSHGFLGFDGGSPDAIAEAGRANVRAYSTVELREAYATEIRGKLDAFVVRTDSGELRARRVILATGVVDDLPGVPGVAELWGRGVYHCPYCDGYERARAPLAVLASSEMSLHQALLVSEWTTDGAMTLLLNGAFEPDAEQSAQLARRHIAIERTPVVRVRDGGKDRVTVELDGGRTLEVGGLFVQPKTRIAEPFAAQLGCELEQGPMGPIYKVDPMLKETTVPGVFACGDVGAMMPAVALAVADGTRAGISAHRTLVLPTH